MDFLAASWLDESKKLRKHSEKVPYEPVKVRVVCYWLPEVPSKKLCRIRVVEFERKVERVNVKIKICLKQV